jgi:MOSC domain-containing protein YiiM
MSAHTLVPPAIGRLRAVLAGKTRPYTRAGSLSAIDKRPLAGAVEVGLLGLAGDEQGDARVHGGVDKAVHCYPWAHYEAWRRELPGASAAELLRQPGAFGENFSLDPGLDEGDVCLADRWAIGDAALFELSQGRQPCWKLNERFGLPDMARRVQQGGRAGWYLRVLRPGAVRAGDAIHLVARPHPDWPLARLLRVIAERDCDPATLRQILALPLPDSWARLFRGRLQSGQVEPWSQRMEGGGGAR